MCSNQIVDLNSALPNLIFHGLKCATFLRMTSLQSHHIINPRVNITFCFAHDDLKKMLNYMLRCFHLHSVNRTYSSDVKYRMNSI